MHLRTPPIRPIPSSSICNAPIARLNVAIPKKSNGSRWARRVSRMKIRMPSVANAPTGRLDVEYPAPVVIVSQPAAERRTDNGAQNGSGTPNRHRSANVARRLASGRRWDRSAMPTTMPCARASSQRSNANCWSDAGSRPKSRPRWHGLLQLHRRLVQPGAAALSPRLPLANVL